MIVKGKVRSVGVKTKLDDNDKELTVLDLRIEVMEGQESGRDMLDLPGNYAKLDISSAQMKLDSSA